jgi:hypothetical protein
MRELLNLQTAQFGKPGQTMSLKEASMAAECNHACWVFPTNFLIDIRGGSTVWLKPTASVWENGSAWCLVDLRASRQPHRPARAVERGTHTSQMAWAMGAYRQENDGALVRPEDVEKRAREELAKMENEPKAGAGEGMSACQASLSYRHSRSFSKSSAV